MHNSISISKNDFSIKHQESDQQVSATSTYLDSRNPSLVSPALQAMVKKSQQDKNG